jgi:hypothetical protein
MAAMFSLLAYEDDFDIEGVYGLPQYPRFTPVEVVNNGADRAHVFRDRITEVCWVVFRGTDDLTDLVNDLRCGLSSDDYGFQGDIHEGFGGTVKGFLVPVLAALRRSGRKQNSPVYTTGHSRGGALAGLYTAYQNHWRTDTDRAYTFGAPRYGDVRLMETLEEMVYAFENVGDPIPSAPPTTLGYASPGVFVLSKTDAKFVDAFPTQQTSTVRRVLNDIGSILRFAAFSVAPRILFNRIKSRHSAAVYLDRVTAVLKTQTERSTL